LKIALLTFLSDPKLGGGAAYAALNQAQGLAACGHSVTLITTSNQLGWNYYAAININVYSIHSHTLYAIQDKDHQPSWKKALFQLLDLYNPFVFSAVQTILSSEQPDLVHTMKIRGLSTAVWPAAASLGIPIIHTAHDYEIISPQGLLQGRIGEWARKGSLPMRPYQAIRRALSQSVSVFTAPSQATLQPHLRLGFFPNARHQVVPNTHGLTAKQLREEEMNYQVSTSPIRFLYLGRLEEEKGIRLLCHAFSRLPANLAVHLDIAGSGSMEAQLHAEYAANPRITFHGLLWGEEKKAVLRAAHALVVPSLVPEAFGISIIEAYAYGKPVIASAIGAIPEIVESPIGILFPPGDETALIIALIEFVSHPIDPQRSTACLMFARNYTSERVLAQYMDLYQGITISPCS
jgi:glycosyltransferase involved in cell wall biosynthesis